MPTDPKDFFLEYVHEPYEAWIRNELCKWKAMAVVNGLSALMEYSFLKDTGRSVNDTGHKKALNHYRKNLPRPEDHDHIRFVAEVYKHVERWDPSETPNTLSDMANQEAGAFSRDFDPAFDTLRNQLGFPFQATPKGKGVWVPLRGVATRCVEYWRGKLL